MKNFEQRLSALEKQVGANRQQLMRAKNAKAILVLGIVLFMVAEFDIPLPWGGRIQTSRLGPEITQVFLLGAWAVGAIALEDLLQIKKNSPSGHGDTKPGSGD